jgi:hypothetical protein
VTGPIKTECVCKQHRTLTCYWTIACGTVSRYRGKNPDVLVDVEHFGVLMLKIAVDNTRAVLFADVEKEKKSDDFVDVEGFCVLLRPAVRGFNDRYCALDSLHNLVRYTPEEKLGQPRAPPCTQNLKRPIQSSGLILPSPKHEGQCSFRAGMRFFLLARKNRIFRAKLAKTRDLIGGVRMLPIIFKLFP